MQVKYALERAFVPNLSRYKIFGVTDMIEDMILIEGVVADFNTRELFIAPCCIPRLLYLVKNFYTNFWITELHRNLFCRRVV